MVWITPSGWGWLRDLGLPLGTTAIVALLLWRLIMREPRESPWAALGIALDFTLLIGGTGATALAALVLEDALPGLASAGSATFDVRRWAMTGSAVGLVYAAYVLRKGRKERLGTLYYIRFLSEWMHDWQIDDLRRRGRSLLDSRTLGGRITRRPDPFGVLDVADDVTRLSRDLQLIMADDDSATGYNLAVNAVWPASVAMGFELVRWDHLAVESAPPPRRHGEPPKQGLAFDLGSLPGPDVPRGFVLATTSVAESGAAATSSAALPTVWLSLDLTGRCDPVTWHHDIAYGLWFSDAELSPMLPARQLSAQEFQDRIVVDIDVANRPKRARDSRSPGHARSEVSPVVAVAACVWAVRHVLHEHPGSPVILTARIPPPVAVALGYFLGNRSGDIRDPGCGHVGCGNLSCHHVLRHLYLGLPKQPRVAADPDPYHLARVHDSQDEPDAIRSTLALERRASEGAS